MTNFITIYNTKFSGALILETSSESDQQSLTVNRAAHFKPENEEHETITDFLDDHEFSGAPVVWVLPVSEGYLRYKHTPFTDQKKIEDTASYEIEDLIHSATLDELQLDYSIVGFSSSGSCLQTGAIKRTRLTSLLQSLNQQDLDCISIQFDLISCYQYLKLSGTLHNDASCWLIHCDRQYISFLLIHEGIPLQTRNFYLPADPVNQDEIVSKIVREMKSTHMAEGFIPFPNTCLITGQPPEDTTLQTVSERLNEDYNLDATATIPDQIRSLQSDFTEKGAVREAMKEAMLDTSANEQQYPDSFNINWNVDQSRKDYLAPLGAACAALLHLPNNIEFRKEEFAYRSLWDAIKKPVFLLSVVLFLSALSFLAVSKVNHQNAVDLKTSYETALQQMFRKTFPDQEVPAPDRIEPAFSKKIKQLQSQLKSENIPIKSSALERWRQLFRKLNVRGELHFTSLSISLDPDQKDQTGSIQIRGKASNGRLPEKLKNQISNLPQFSRANNYQIQKNNQQDMKYAFSFSVSIQSSSS